MIARPSPCRPRLRRFALLGAVFLLTGCELIKAAEEPTDLYQVSPKSTFEPNMPSVQWQLAVEVPAAAANLNTGRIAISKSPTSSDYFAKTAWTDRAPAMVQTRIVDSFENSHKIVAVSRDSIGLRANYTLQPDLRNFEAMYFYGGAPIAHVRIVAKLVRMPERQIIGTATIERCVRAREDKVPKVVEAFDQALGSVMKRLVAWTLKAAPARPPSDEAPYDIGRYRNPDNAYLDSANCPKGNDASMVPLTDE
jgi:cholesterol transport system auxiliary component